MKRRTFLQAMLAAGVAPAAIGSGILMPVREIIKPNNDLVSPYYDGISRMGLIVSGANGFSIGSIVDSTGLGLPDGRYIVSCIYHPDDVMVLHRVG